MKSKLSSYIKIHITGGNGTYDVGDWHEFTITRTLGNLTGESTISYMYNPAIEWGTMMSCQARITLVPASGGERSLMTGFVTNVTRTFGAEGVKVVVTVKDKTVDLLECNPIISPPESMNFDATYIEKAQVVWRTPVGSTDSAFPDYNQYRTKFGIVAESDSGIVHGATGNYFNPKLITKAVYELAPAIQIIKEIVAPFGIEVVSTAFNDSTVIQKFEVVEDQTCWSHIDKIVKQLGITCFTDGDGRLHLSTIDQEFRMGSGEIITGASEGVTHVITRDEILELEDTWDFSNRYSFYKVRYQAPVMGDPMDSEADFNVFTMPDSAVKRWRPVAVQPEQEYFGKGTQYATWLRNRQRGGSHILKIKSPYWFSRIKRGNTYVVGKVYQVGDVCAVSASGWRIGNDQLVISGIEMSITPDEGRECNITLSPLETYFPVIGSLESFESQKAIDTSAGIKQLRQPSEEKRIANAHRR